VGAKEESVGTYWVIPQQGGALGVAMYFAVVGGEATMSGAPSAAPPVWCSRHDTYDAAREAARSKNHEFAELYDRYVDGGRTAADWNIRLAYLARYRGHPPEYRDAPTGHIP
jgi:hypothetical protein